MREVHDLGHEVHDLDHDVRDRMRGLPDVIGDVPAPIDEAPPRARGQNSRLTVKLPNTGSWRWPANSRVRK